MTRKLFALTVVGLIAALAAFGLIRDRTVATSDPLPIQPFFPEVNITLGSSDLDWGPLDSDTGTAESGGAQTLTDTDKSWAGDQWAGYFLHITGGTGEGQIHEIAGNTSDTLRVYPNWKTPPDDTSDYVILPPTQSTVDIEDVIGTRWYLPMVYSAKGFRLTPDLDVTNGSIVGSGQFATDALCDGSTDIFAKADAPPILPDDSTEETTNMDPHPGPGDDDNDWIADAGPPFEPIYRQLTAMSTMYVGGDPGAPTPMDPPVPLNVVEYAIPWAPGARVNHSALLGAGPPGTTCLDSPQYSLTRTSTTLVKNPASGGDAGGPLTNQSELHLHGLVPIDPTTGSNTNVISLPNDESVTIRLVKRFVNQGPEVGDFEDMWVVETPILYADPPGVQWQPQTGDVCTDGQWAIGDYYGDPPWESGTAESGGQFTLTDNDKSWAVDEWQGFYVAITGGYGAGQSNEILSNDSNTLDLVFGWTAPGDTSTYEIYQDACDAWMAADDDVDQLNLQKDDINVAPNSYWMSRDLTLDCGPASSETSFILAVKNIAWPKTGTFDNDLQDNVALTVIRLDCGGAVTGVPVDKSVTMIQAPHYVALDSGGSTIVTVREINANHTEWDVDTEEWFDAETSQTGARPGFSDDLFLQWQAQAGDWCTLHRDLVGEYTGAGGDCDTWIGMGGDVTDLHFQVENPGTLNPEGTGDPRDTNQSAVSRDLTITCPDSPAVGTFPVVIKKVLAPKARNVIVEDGNIDSATYTTITDTGKSWDTHQWKGYVVEGPLVPARRIVANTSDTLTVDPPWATPPHGLYYIYSGLILEQTPADNAQYHVITVDCGGTPDGTDDAAGLYPRWTALISQMDYRRSLGIDQAGNPIDPPDTDTPADTRYYERMVSLSCFYIGPGGTVNQNDWGNWPAGIDEDHDCLQNAASAQPGHPVDPDDDPSDNSDCPAIVYSENIVVQHNQAADLDCDGLLDGIEMAWGSNPVDADTDGDGASDFDEMFNYTNPLDPDTDDDGLLDKPEDDYIAALGCGAETGETVGEDDNCVNVYNPYQTNSDGAGHDNGDLGGPTGSMGAFNGDTLGDACDNDDDNDGIADVAELYYQEKHGGSCVLDPFNIDTDGDHRADGPEIQMGKDPCVADSPPASLDQAQCLLFHGGNFNVPPQGWQTGAWNGENDGSEDDREEDSDNDGLLNCQDPVDDDDGDAPNFGYSGVEITDVVEVRGYNTLPAVVDSDGDGCPDWQEIADINGDGAANILDVQTSAQCNLGKSAAKGCSTGAPNTDSLFVADINKDGANNILDVQLTALNTLAKGGMPICTSNQAGPNLGQR